MTDQLSEEKIAECKAVFALFDKEGIGFIPTKDMGVVFRKLGLNPTETELHDIISDIDVDGKGTIDFEEFLVYMVKKEKGGVETEEDIKEAFRVFDTDGNGFVSAEKIKNVLTTMGEMLNDEEMDAMLKVCGMDEDGQINYEEFVKAMFA